MAKRFTDTNKFKRPFYRGLQAPYKLLWDYLYHECDHAGIWIVDFEIAQIYVGKDAPINKADALALFNNSEKRIIEFDGGQKWFIIDFISFQYGTLNPDNRAHNSVIQILSKHKLINKDYKPLTSPLQGDKDMDKDKEMDKDMVKEQKTILFEKRTTELNADIGLNDADIEKFNLYWTASGEKDKKLHFEKQKTFDHKKRMATWKLNSRENYKPVSTYKPDHSLTVEEALERAKTMQK